MDFCSNLMWISSCWNIISPFPPFWLRNLSKFGMHFLHAKDSPNWKYTIYAWYTSYVCLSLSSHNETIVHAMNRFLARNYPKYPQEPWRLEPSLDHEQSDILVHVVHLLHERFLCKSHKLHMAIVTSYPSSSLLSDSKCWFVSETQFGLSCIG